MEAIFELLCELFCEFFIEGCMEAAGHSRIPKWIRILLMTVPFAFIETLFILIAGSGVNNRNIFLAAFCFSLAGVFLLLWIYLLTRILKNKPFHH